MEWIKVKDKLPEEGLLVLTVNMKNKDFPEFSLDYVVIYPEEPNGFVWAKSYVHECENITHWMHLPEIPTSL